MSLRGTLSSASWRGFQSLDDNWGQIQVFNSENYLGGAISGNGLYLGLIHENLIEIYLYDGSSYIFQEQIQPDSDIFTNTLINSMCFDYTGAYFAFNNIGNSGVGSVGIYNRSGTTWSLQQQILPSDTPQNYFGVSVSINYNASYLLVGNPESTSDTNSYGSAYIFTRSGSVWTQQQKITQSDQQIKDRFGVSVSIAGDATTLVVGSPSSNGITGRTGKVYTFSRSGSTWTEQQKITPPAVTDVKNWGQYVSMSNNNSYFSATSTRFNTVIPTVGVMGVYNYSGTWTLQSTLTDPVANQWYGGGTQLDYAGNTVFTGGDISGPKARLFGYTNNVSSWELDITLVPIPPTAAVSQNQGTLIGINYDATRAVLITVLNPPVQPQVYIFSKA